MRAVLYLISCLSAVSLLVVSARFLTGNSATAPAKATQAVEVEAPEKVLVVPDRFYRWRDATGHIHFSSTPPPVSVVAEEIPFVREVPVPEALADPLPGAIATGRGLDWAGPLSVYTPDGFADLMDDVEETTKRLEERDQQLDDMRKLLRGR